MSKSHMLLLIIILFLLWIVIGQYVLASKFGLHYPNINVLDNANFHHFNPSLSLYKGKMLKIWRIDNRRIIINNYMFFWLPGEKYYTDHAMWCVPYTQNYVALQYNTESPKIVTLPILPGMRQEIQWWKQYEDARIFVHTKSSRVFFTSTVICDDNIRISLIEMNTDTWEFKTGFILNDPAVVGDSIAQKNWTLFEDANGDVFVLTDVYPTFKIYSIDIDTGKMILKHENSTNVVFKKYSQSMHIRCSTMLVPYTPTTLICAIHVRDKTIVVQSLLQQFRYRTIFVEVNNQSPFQVLRISPILTFEDDQFRIEFASGLSWDEDHKHLVLGLGIEDQDLRYVQLNPEAIFSIPSTLKVSKMEDTPN